MEPAVGFEPTTDGLQNRSSTTELSWLDYSINLHHFSDLSSINQKNLFKKLPIFSKTGILSGKKLSKGIKNPVFPE